MIIPIRVEKKSHVQIEADRKRREKLSFDLRSKKQYETGIIVRVHSRTKYDVLIPGRAHPYTEVPPLEPIYLRKGDVVKLGFLEDNTGIPFILCRAGVQRKRFFLGGIVLSPWPTYRANYSRQNCIPGTYTPGTPTLGPAASAITRSTEETIWDYRGNPEEQYPELPMTLYRDGESVDLTGFVIFDLSLVDDDLLALAEDDAEVWNEGLDGAGWDDDTVQKQALRRISPDGETIWAYYAPVRSFPEYDPGGGGDPGGGDDDDDGGAS